MEKRSYKGRVVKKGKYLVRVAENLGESRKCLTVSWVS